MILNSLNIVILGTLALIIVPSTSVFVLAENDFTSEQIETGRYSMADPNGPGVGEGVSEDGTSRVSSQYLEHSEEEIAEVSSADVESSVLNGCNCVVFRMDDLQDFFVSTVQAAIMDEFTQRGEFLSIGPVFVIFGGDSTVTDPALAGVSSGLFELFNHGWFHNDFSLEPFANQTAHLQLVQDKAELLFGSNTTFFVPPFNAFNNDTLDAMVSTDFETISSEGVVDFDPHYVADGTSDIVDSRGLYHLPSDVKFIDFGVNPPARISNTQILDDIDTSITSRGYAVVTLHAQDHAQTFSNGTYINAPNATLMADLEAIIDGVNLKNYPIRTFGQVLAFNGTVSIDDVTQVEGDSGANNFVFTVTRSNNSGTLTVDYSTEDDSANSPSDYSFTSGTLNFTDGGSLTQIFAVSVNGDFSIESDETFNVNLSNCVGCTITDSQGIGNITNDDSVNVSIDDVTLTEGDSGTTDFVFNVTRSNNNGAISVQYQTADDTATGVDSDYAALSLSTLNFSDGGLFTKFITVSVNGDGKAELDETFNVNLSNCTNCTITDGQGVGTITNDDTPTVSIDDVAQAEGNSGTTDFVFIVTRSSNVGAISVLYQTADNTATFPSDYTSLSLTQLNFGDGGTLTQTITVPVKGDVLLEPHELFNVNISNCVGCTIADNQGVGSILDDDTAGAHIQSIGSAGTGDGQFNSPADVATDSNDRIIVADTFNHRIQIFDSDGNHIQNIGNFGSLNGEFNNAQSVAVDSTDRIIVADFNNHRIQIFNSAGVHQLSFGNFGVLNGFFKNPTGVAIDSTDRIIVADTSNNRIQIFNSAGQHQISFGSFGGGDGQFSIPSAVTVDSADRIIVLDSGNQRVQIFDSAGNHIQTFGSFGIDDGQFRAPLGIGPRSADRIIVGDTNNNRVQIFDSAGSHLQSFGTGGSGAGQFNNPTGIAIDSTERIVVADKINHRIQVFHGSPPIQNDLDSDGTPDDVDPENIISSSITITSSHLVGNVIVQNGAVLTIPNGLGISITSGNSLTIESGGGVLVNLGGFLLLIS